MGMFWGTGRLYRFPGFSRWEERFKDMDELTDSAREHGFVVNVALHPAHEVLNVFWRRHLGGPFVVFRVLPEVFKSKNRPLH